MSRVVNEILLRSGTRDRQDYLNEMKGEEFLCNLCGKSFKAKKEFDMHKDGRNSDKSYFCKALKEDFIDEAADEEETDGGAEGEPDAEEGEDEVSKLKAEIKKLKAEIKELKGGKKKKKKKDSEDDSEDDDEDYDGDGDNSAADSDDDKMAKLRAMKKESFDEYGNKLDEGISNVFIGYLTKVIRKLQAKENLSDKEKTILKTARDGRMQWKAIKDEGERKSLEKKVYKQLSNFGNLIDKSKKISASNMSDEDKMKAVRKAAKVSGKKADKTGWE